MGKEPCSNCGSENCFAHSDKLMTATQRTYATYGCFQRQIAALQAKVEGMRDVLDIERLAALEHEQWAHWTKYFLENLTADNIARWKKQIRTPYEDLSDEEKEADRKWARKILGESLLSPTPAGDWVSVRRKDLEVIKNYLEKKAAKGEIGSTTLSALIHTKTALGTGGEG